MTEKGGKEMAKQLFDLVVLMREKESLPPSSDAPPHVRFAHLSSLRRARPFTRAIVVGVSSSRETSNNNAVVAVDPGVNSGVCADSKEEEEYLADAEASLSAEVEAFWALVDKPTKLRAREILKQRQKQSPRRKFLGDEMTRSSSPTSEEEG